METIRKHDFLNGLRKVVFCAATNTRHPTNSNESSYAIFPQSGKY